MQKIIKKYRFISSYLIFAKGPAFLPYQKHACITSLILLQIVGGRLAELYGTRWVFGGCIFGGALCTLLSPLMAKLHYAGLIFLRVLLGLTQSQPCWDPAL